MVEVGSDVDRRRLFNDWVLVHELIHTGMPYIRSRGSWLMEGAATYVEPIIRARAGWKTEEEVWREWLENMPHGVAGFSRGLSTTSGRDVYWPGAIFMLLADLAIRRDTQGAKGLEDCLRGILWEGLDGSQWTTVTDYGAACDRVSGTHAVSALIDRHYNKSEAIDLDALWKELGVSLVAGRVSLDDTAPSARWRKLIVPGILPPRRVKLPWES
jgi:predicted metalloprotease with PDZ domain